MDNADKGKGALSMDDAAIACACNSGYVYTRSSLVAKDGSRVVVLNMCHKSSQWAPEDTCRSVYYVIENILNDERAQHNGLTVINNMDKATRQNYDMKMLK